jgi:hypothetical protein
MAFPAGQWDRRKAVYSEFTSLTSGWSTMLVTVAAIATGCSVAKTVVGAEDGVRITGHQARWRTRYFRPLADGS